MQIKLPGIPLDISVCDGSDNEDLEVKQEPIESDEVKSEDFPTGLEFEDPRSDFQDARDVITDAQPQKFTEQGRLQLMMYTCTISSLLYMCVTQYILYSCTIYWLSGLALVWNSRNVLLTNLTHQREE